MDGGVKGFSVVLLHPNGGKNAGETEVEKRARGQPSFPWQERGPAPGWGAGPEAVGLAVSVTAGATACASCVRAGRSR